MKRAIQAGGGVDERGDFRSSAGPWRWFTVVGFAIAMAWVESAVVFYLRTFLDRLEPYQPNPLPLVGGIGPAEVIREAATLVMLLSVGVLAGNTWRSRWGFAALAFGVWDVFYYVFLRVMTGWPKGLGDWDILFLIPLPWWGPVWAPVSIALLMAAWGSLVSRWDAVLSPEDGRVWGIAFVGIGLALYCFMVDALRVAEQGERAVRDLLPTEFSTGWFLLALALMSAPLLRAAAQLTRGMTRRAALAPEG